jgi:hypothetical protein
VHQSIEKLVNLVSLWAVAADDGSGAIGASDRSATDAFGGLNHTIHHQLT